MNIEVVVGALQCCEPVGQLQLECRADLADRLTRLGLLGLFMSFALLQLRVDGE